VQFRAEIAEIAEAQRSQRSQRTAENRRVGGSHTLSISLDKRDNVLYTFFDEMQPSKGEIILQFCLEWPRVLFVLTVDFVDFAVARRTAGQ
jgi:hypothetical protein